MPFLHAIQQSVVHYSQGSAERLVLDYLLQHGVGRANSQPWASIEAHLQGHGFAWRLQTFQQGLLKASREGDMYIGSNDHAPYRGYFILNPASKSKFLSVQFASCARSIRALLVSPGSEARNSVDSFHRLPSPSMNWMNQYGEFIFR